MIRTVSSREAYRNDWLRLREDVIELADGSRSVYGVVEKQDFALVVPREADGSLWLVEQYRYAVGRRAWEFPQGAWAAGQEGGTPEDLARAELREETGLSCGSLRHLGRLASAYGFCAQSFDVFLAGDLVPGEPDREASEQDMRCARVSREEFLAMVARGDVVDGHTMAAWALLGLHDAG